MVKIVIFGTGDIAELAYYYFSTDSDYQVVAFTVDQKYKSSDKLLELPVLDFENIENSYPANEFKMFIALSYAQMNKLREEKYHKAKEKGYSLVSYISSRCTFLSQFQCGDNCFILEDNTIQPFVKIGNNVTLWSGNHIGHHSLVNDNCFITSHVVVSGHCEIGKNSFIGVNSTLAHTIKVGPNTLIGAGSIITKDTKEKEVYVPPRSVLLEKNSDQVKI